MRNDSRETIIGGEMGIDPTCVLSAWKAIPVQPLAAGQTVTSGRAALRLIVRRMKEEKGNRLTVLLPAYLCSTMLQPFQEANVSVRFFNIDRDMAIDRDDLSRNVEALNPDAILFINYFGFPVSPPEQHLLMELKRDYLIIEDCVQGSLIEQTPSVVGQIGDFALTSFRKYLPVPDGGLLFDHHSGAPIHSLPSANSLFVYTSLISRCLRYHCSQSRGSGRLEPKYIQLSQLAEWRLNTENEIADMSDISKRLIRMIDFDEVMKKRRANFQILLEAFEQIRELRDQAEPVFESLPKGVSPLVFPIRVRAGRRDGLRSELARRRAYCPVHWPMPIEVSEATYPSSYVTSREILGLPIDQRYGADEMADVTERTLLAAKCLT